MLLQESYNLPAAHIIGVLPKELATVPSLGSGSFPAISNSSVGNRMKQSPAPASLPSEGHFISPPSTPINQKSPPTPASSNSMPTTSNTKTSNYFVLPAGAFLTLAVAMLFMCRSRTTATIVPWDTGSRGQLQNAFLTGDFTS